MYYVANFIPFYDDTTQLSMLLFWEKSFCIRKVVGRIGIWRKYADTVLPLSYEETWH